MNIIKDLVKLANRLDEKGFTKEADFIDLIIKKSWIPQSWTPDDPEGKSRGYYRVPPHDNEEFISNYYNYYKTPPSANKKLTLPEAEDSNLPPLSEYLSEDELYHLELKNIEEEALLNCEKFIELYEKYKRLSNKAPAPMPAPRPPRHNYLTPEEEERMRGVREENKKREQEKKEEGVFKEYFKYLKHDDYFMEYMNCKFGFTDKQDYVCNLLEFKYMKNKKGYPSICSSKIYDIKFEYENLEDLDKKRLKEIIEKGNY